MDTNVAAAIGVTVRPVRTKRDLKRFIDFPYRFYKKYPHWVPPLRRDVASLLNPKKHPFFEHGRLQSFLAEDERGAVVGRIAGIVNGTHLKTFDDGVGFFGFFECEERYETAAALLDAACQWVRDQGLTRARGPANPSLHYTAGVLVEGFDREPSLMMPYNPPYYEGFLLRYGFDRAMTMWAYYIHEKYMKMDRLRRGAELVYRRNPDLRLRTFDVSRFDEEALIVREIYNEAWADNWGYVPITDAEFDYFAAELKQIIDPNLIYILEKDGEPVAFSLSLPNINLGLRRIRNGRLFPTGLFKLLALDKLGGFDEVRMALMGVRPAYQGRAFDVISVLATMDNGPALGYYACEMSWILDSNHTLLNLMPSIGAVVDKEYALFEKLL
ncbi:MAG: hypothetical protein IH820_05275 [Bacteroidetes bacterium]|nr:hypothetical protein [Bacteroidota bacterium]